MNLIPIFITGLTVGGITCLAVQGGILASIITSREEEEVQNKVKRKNSLWPVAAFLGAKLIAYTMLGVLLGFIGQALTLTDTARTVMQFVAGGYMIAVALNLLNVHPVFRYVLIQPPHFLRRFVNNQTTRQDLFAPAIFGCLTIFLPCGTTLAMEALAISSGSPWWGAAIMATFTMATMPYFFGLGWVTTKLSDVYQQRFLKIAALVIIYLGVVSVNGGLNLVGSPLTLQSIGRSFYEHSRYANQADDSTGVQVVNGVQAATIDVYATSYQPNYVQVRAGIPVQLTLNAKGGLGCTSIFRIPQLGIQESLQQSPTKVVEFTPTQPGKLTWTCGMGMYTGVMDVI
jgi:sulfite exporter TauE/SafE